MQLVKFLEENKTGIIKDSLAGLEKIRLKHYSESRKETNEERLNNLYAIIIDCVNTKSLVQVYSYCESLAEKRFNSGFDLFEVQSTINVLEEIIWKKIISDLPPADYEQALGLVSTILGAGKDSLACKYVSLASQCRKPSLDLSGLFSNKELS